MTITLQRCWVLFNMYEIKPIKTNWVKLPDLFVLKENATCLSKASFHSPTHYEWSLNTKPKPHPVSAGNPIHKFFPVCCAPPAFQNQCLFLESLNRFPNRNLQCESDFLPFNMRRRITSMPPCELILLIQPWVLLRLMFLGWYSVPLFRVRTCWYCHGSCWNSPEPSACEESGPHLEIWGPAAALDTIQLLNNLRWNVPVVARFPAGMLLKEHRLTNVTNKCYFLILCHNTAVITLKL